MRNHLIILVTIAFLTPQISSAMLFGGSNYLSAKSLVSGEPSTQITYMGWIYGTTTTSAANVIISIAHGGGNNSYLRAQTLTSIRFVLTIGGALRTVNTTGGNYNTNKWNHLAGTWDGTKMTVYINGASTTSLTITGTLDAYASDYKIGALAPCNPTCPIFMSGHLADVRVYNRALSQNEIRNYYYLGAASRNGLVHHWPLWNNGMDLANPLSFATTTGSVLQNRLPPVGRYRR